MPAAPPLSPDSWRQVFAAADQALELLGDAREVFVGRWCTDHPALGPELRALLASGDTRSTLDVPAAALAAPLLAQLSLERDTGLVSRIGSYRVVQEIGRGGMGTVYLAERDDDQYRKRVAVKLLPPWSAADEHRVRRFVEERQILAALEHPDIARLIDGGVTPDGLPWFAMEYVEGAPIDRYCDEHGLTIEQRLELFRRVCAAVAYAHRNLVVHRDLKPGNILVDADGGVRLLDFGIAKLLGGDGAAALTQTGDRVMTPLYASPEQVRGAPISTASDVYALGVLLHELLTGRDPYRLPSRETYEVAHAILEREPERPSMSVARAGANYDVNLVAGARATTPARLRRRLDGDLDMIAVTALDKDPARRYRSVEQLEADVQRHLTGLPIAARADGRLYRARKFVRRHKAGVAAGTIFALVVVGFAVITGVQAVRIRAEANRVAAERNAAEAALDFIEVVTRTSVPSPREGRGVTTREVLDTSAARIETGLPGQPAARARLMYEFGRAYHQLGVNDRAQHLLESSLAVRRTLHPAGQRDLDETLDALGGVLLDRSDVGRAERAYDEALVLRRRLLGPMHGDVARTLNGLAAVRLRQGHSRDAEGLAREALTIDRQRVGETRADVAQSLRSLGRAIADEGDDVHAQRLYREALLLFLQVLGEDHPDVAATEFDLAASLKHSGDNDQADSVFRHATALYRRLVSTASTATTAPAQSWSLPPSPAARGAVLALGSKIVFVSDRDGPDPVGDLGRSEIYIMNSDGSDQRRLTNSDTVKGFPVLSPDGRKIAFNSGKPAPVELYVMNVDGTGRARLTNLTESRLGARRPAWSPDGKKLAFQSYSQPDIYVVNADGTGLKNLTSRPGADRDPTWSPDGHRIAFASDRDSMPGIYVMNEDGSHPVLLIGRAKRESPAVWATPVWSPDGSKIAFARGQGADRDIWVVNADGTGLVRLTTNPTEDGHPSWSPDSRHIVFHRRVLGHMQIFVMKADGSDVRPLTELSTVAFNGFPSWGRVAQTSPSR